MEEANSIRIPFIDGGLKELLGFADEFDRRVVQGLLVPPSPIERDAPFLQLMGLPIENARKTASVWPRDWRVNVLGFVACAREHVAHASLSFGSAMTFVLSRVFSCVVFNS